MAFLFAAPRTFFDHFPTPMSRLPLKVRLAAAASRPQGLTPPGEQTWKVIRKLFPPEQHEEVGQLLTGECSDNLPLTYEYQRIQLAVLKLSHGDLDELMLRITEAQQDWRDILMAAGFGHSVTEHLSWANSYLYGEEAPWSPWQNREAMPAKLFDSSWVKCPRCGLRFDTEDLQSWTGKRHRRCGQLLDLTAP
jgi:hypothetical protein